MKGTRMTCRAALAILLAIVPATAQKVQISVDKSANFSQYKRYSWSKNYLLTRQAPDDQKAIGDALKNSINQQLLAKGYILDDKNPDFSVSYEAGGMSKADISTTPDLSRDIGNPNSMNQPADIGPPMTSTDAWVSVLGGVRITVIDAKSQKKVWVGQVSQKIRDPQKFMANLDAQVDEATRKLMKTFPASGK